MLKDIVQMFVGNRTPLGISASDCHEVFPRDLVKIDWPKESEVDVECGCINIINRRSGRVIKQGYSVRSVDDSFKEFHVSTIGVSPSMKSFEILAAEIARQLPHKETILVHVH